MQPLKKIVFELRVQIAAARATWKYLRTPQYDDGQMLEELRRHRAKEALKHRLLGTFRRHRRKKKTITSNSLQRRGVHPILDRLETIVGKLRKRNGAREPLADYLEQKLKQDPIPIRRPGDDDDRPSTFLAQLNADVKNRGRFDLAQPCPSTPSQVIAAQAAKTGAGLPPHASFADVHTDDTAPCAAMT